LSNLHHTAIGGLPGILLTCADIDTNSATSTKKNGVDIVGPSGTQQFYQSLSHFMQRKDFHVRIKEGNVEKLVVEAPASKRSPEQISISIQSFSVSATDTKGCNTPSPSTVGVKRPRSGSDDGDSSEVLSFLFTSPPIPGKFQPQKASELGVPKGPLFGKLKSGQSVTFLTEDGEKVTVSSNQVVSPSTPGIAVLVLCYPTPAIADSLMTSNQLQSSLTADIILDVVCHLTDDVDLMQRVIKQINEHVHTTQGDNTVEHIFVSPNQPDYDGTPFRAAAISAIARSCLSSDIYRIPQSYNISAIQGASDDGYKIGRTLMDYQLLPRTRKGFTRLSLPAIDSEEGRDFASKSGAIAEAKRLLIDNLTEAVSNQTQSNGELVFTGTASSLPCKYRNVTGMALKADNGNWFLLDVGESTIGNLLRTHGDLGDEESPLARIRGVWISHPHADHHLGIIRLLQDRRSGDPLILIAPPPLFRFLEDYSRVEKDISDRFIAVNCWHLRDENVHVNNMLRQAFGFTDIRAVQVEHCAHAFAVILGGTPFGRLVYSGDCRPSKNLAQAAIGADVLIHEATFEDGMEAEALLKRHSTIGEALNVAHQMQAKLTILTHFSQRYPKVPPVPAAEQGSMPIIFAFDYMCLRPQTLLTAARLTPAIRLLFPEQDESEVAVQTAKDVAKAEQLLSIPGLFARPGII
jgi:ribonuclease Z